MKAIITQAKGPAPEKLSALPPKFAITPPAMSREKRAPMIWPYSVFKIKMFDSRLAGIDQLELSLPDVDWNWDSSAGEIPNQFQKLNPL